MSTITDRISRLRYGHGLTFAQIRARLKDFPQADVRAAVIWAQQHRVIQCVRRQHNGIEWAEFQKVTH